MTQLILIPLDMQKKLTNNYIIKKDLTGLSYNDLTVLGFSHANKNKNTSGYTKYWECVCVCGKVKLVRHSSIVTGNIKSCGCRIIKNSSEMFTVHGDSNKTSKYNRLYSIWLGIKKRTSSACQRKDTHLYYGKGIRICKEWHDYSNFKEWALTNKYADNLVIDRIDSNKDYSPKNCRWVTPAENSRNTSSCIIYKGETASEASRRLGGGGKVVRDRVKKLGWALEDAFSIPYKSLSKYKKIS